VGLGPLDGAGTWDQWGGWVRWARENEKRTAAVSLPFREPEMNTLLMRTWPSPFFKSFILKNLFSF
jgi:hypothetical protein